MTQRASSPSYESLSSRNSQWRFYVAAAWHGRGIAHALMKSVEMEARALEARTLWLGVWERNERAKSFYRQCGFADVGSQVFVLGTDAQTDRIMVRLLPSEPRAVSKCKPDRPT